MTMYGRLFDSELQIVVQTELPALGQMMVWGGGGGLRSMGFCVTRV